MLVWPNVICTENIWLVSVGKENQELTTYISVLQLSEDLQIDYESYEWKKLDYDNADTKKMITEYFCWEGDFAGKKFNTGKIFKWNLWTNESCVEQIGNDIGKSWQINKLLNTLILFGE